MRSSDTIERTEYERLMRSRQEPESAADAEWVSKPVPEIAVLLGVSVRFAWQLVADGRLRSFKLGTRRFVRRVDLLEFVDGLAAEELELRERVAA